MTTAGGIEDRYELLERIGEGAQSVVYAATCRKTKRRVAVKEIKSHSSSHRSDTQHIPVSKLALNFREIAILQRIGPHPNLIELLEVVFDSKTLYIVMDHCGINLSEFIASHARSTSRGLPLSLIKSIALQILRGLDFVHSQLVLHRDCKPQNIFISPQIEVKIGDLGLSKAFTSPQAPETLSVASLWYRSPEAVLQCGYDVGLDLWSFGCILAELAKGSPLFYESSEFGLLMRIFQTLGTPTKAAWPVLAKTNNYSELWPKWHAPDCVAAFRNVFQPLLGSHGFELLLSLLQFDSNLRPRCKEAMAHPFFLGQLGSDSPDRASYSDATLSEELDNSLSL